MEGPGALILILLVGGGIWLAVGFGTASIAESKGRERGAWLVAGLLGGLIALIIVSALKPLPEVASRYRTADAPRAPGPASELSDPTGVPTAQEVIERATAAARRGSSALASDTRECPFCAEEIKARAFKCRYCMSEVDPTMEEDNEPEPAPLSETEDAPSATPHRLPPGGLAAYEVPDPDSEPMAQLTGRLEVYVRHQEDDWAQIETGAGWVAWVDGRRLIPLTDPDTGEAIRPLEIRPDGLVICPRCEAATATDIGECFWYDAPLNL